MKKTRLRWKDYWKQSTFRNQFILFILIIIGIAFFFPGYFDYLEAREGTLMNDFLVSMFHSTDVSWYIFVLLYGGIIIGLASNHRYPKIYLMIIQTYAMVTIMRIITLYFIPLNPPEGYIELKEPFLSAFFTTEGKICSKDLFFSGHVSTILSVYYSMKQSKYKIIVLIFSILVGLLLLVQHVHYTIDVLVSPVATYIAYRISKKFLTRKIKESA